MRLISAWPVVHHPERPTTNWLAIELRHQQGADSIDEVDGIEAEDRARVSAVQVQVQVQVEQFDVGEAEPHALDRQPFAAAPWRECVGRDAMFTKKREMAACLIHGGPALITDPPRDAGLVVRDRDEFAQRVRVPATAISFDGLNKARFASHRYERASRVNHVRRSIRTPFTFVVSKCVVPRPQPGAFWPRMSNGSRNRPFRHF